MEMPMCWIKFNSSGSQLVFLRFSAFLHSLSVSSILLSCPPGRRWYSMARRFVWCVMAYAMMKEYGYAQLHGN